MVFNERFECKTCGTVYQEPEPRLFSFNNPYGACPRCQGFGNTIDFDIDLVIPDRGKSLNEGASRAMDQAALPRACWHEMKRFARANATFRWTCPSATDRRAAQLNRRRRPQSETSPA